MTITEKPGPSRAGTGDVHPALIGLAMLGWTSTWRPGAEVALWRVAIVAELALVEADDFPGPGKAARLAGGLLRVATLAEHSIEREVLR